MKNEREELIERVRRELFANLFCYRPRDGEEGDELDDANQVVRFIESLSPPADEGVERDDWHSSEAERRFLKWNDGQTRMMADRRHAFHAGYAEALSSFKGGVR